jgi:DNA helicase-2/ATP-dependent DNA helicase PcrA
VYLTAVNGYDFPSGLAYDSYISQKWFVRDSLNLEAEAIAQLLSLRDDEAAYEEGAATVKARHEYASERMRLLYVGITRAREELTITWNTGRQGDQQPSLPFVALHTHWQQARAEDE